MTNKEKSAELVNKYVRLFRCPLCYCPMKVIDSKSLICVNNRTFDFAKQGYVNMMNRSINSHYDRELFKARQKIILNSNLFAYVHQMVSEIIIEKMDVLKGEIVIFDAGCGEGSHLNRILDKCENVAIRGVGLDLSKEGIRIAASKYKESIWLVGDLANAPIADQSCGVILNILSPANYKEFKRLLAPNGFVVKVVPRFSYLKELREAIFNTDQNLYKNDDTVSLFKKHFHLENVLNLRYSMELPQDELMDLVQMSPLTWNTNQKEIEKIVGQGISQVTVDFDLLVGKNKLSEGDRG